MILCRAGLKIAREIYNVKMIIFNISEDHIGVDAIVWMDMFVFFSLLAP